MSSTHNGTPHEHETPLLSHVLAGEEWAKDALSRGVTEGQDWAKKLSEEVYQARAAEAPALEATVPATPAPVAVAEKPSPKSAVEYPSNRGKVKGAEYVHVEWVSDPVEARKRSGAPSSDEVDRAQAKMAESGERFSTALFEAHDKGIQLVKIAQASGTKYGGDVVSRMLWGTVEERESYYGETKGQKVRYAAVAISEGDTPPSDQMYWQAAPESGSFSPHGGGVSEFEYALDVRYEDNDAGSRLKTLLNDRRTFLELERAAGIGVQAEKLAIARAGLKSSARAWANREAEAAKFLSTKDIEETGRPVLGLYARVADLNHPHHEGKRVTLWVGIVSVEELEAIGTGRDRTVQELGKIAHTVELWARDGEKPDSSPVSLGSRLGGSTRGQGPFSSGDYLDIAGSQDALTDTPDVLAGATFYGAAGRVFQHVLVQKLQDKRAKSEGEKAAAVKLVADYRKAVETHRASAGSKKALMSRSASMVVRVNAEWLRESLSRVVRGAAKDNQRPVLTAVSFKLRDGTLEFAAADGFRLYISKSAPVDILPEFNLAARDGKGWGTLGDDSPEGSATVLMPQKAVSDLVKRLKGKNGKGMVEIAYAPLTGVSLQEPKLLKASSEHRKRFKDDDFVTPEQIEAGEYAAKDVILIGGSAEKVPVLNFILPDGSSTGAECVRGTFPDYERLIPDTGGGWRATFDPEGMNARLKGIYDRTKGDFSRTVRVEALKEGLRFQSRDREGQTESVLAGMQFDADDQATPARIAINADFLQDVIGLYAKEDMAILHGTTPSSPVLFTGFKYMNQAVVMPMFVQWEREPGEETEAAGAGRSIAGAVTEESGPWNVDEYRALYDKFEAASAAYGMALKDSGFNTSAARRAERDMNAALRPVALYRKTHKAETIGDSAIFSVRRPTQRAADLSITAKTIAPASATTPSGQKLQEGIGAPAPGASAPAQNPGNGRAGASNDRLIQQPCPTCQAPVRFAHGTQSVPCLACGTRLGVKYSS